MLLWETYEKTYVNGGGGGGEESGEEEEKGVVTVGLTLTHSERGQG